MSRFNQLITLVKLHRTKDEIGNTITTTTERTVYANRWRAGLAETASAGVEAPVERRTYEIMTASFTETDKVIVDGKTFDVRDIDTNGDRTMLSLERGVNQR